MPYRKIGNDITLLTQCTTIKALELEEPGMYMGNPPLQIKLKEDKSSVSIDLIIKTLENTSSSESHEPSCLRLVLIGQQAFGAAVLKRLLDDGEHDIVAVCGNPTKSGAAEDPLVSLAKDVGIEVFQPKSWKTEESLLKMQVSTRLYYFMMVC